MRVLVIGATGYVDPGLTTMIITAARSAAPEAGLVYLSALGASAGGNEYLRVRAAVEFALSSGLNPFTVVRPSFIARPDRGESRPAERMGAVLLDSVAVLLGLLGNRRRAAKLASISGPALASMLVGLASEPLDGRVHELDDFRS